VTDNKPENTQDPSTDVVAADAQVDQAVGVRRGMFGTTGTGDTSGYGGLVAPVVLPGAASARTAGGTTRWPTRWRRPSPSTAW
jgi:NADH-quinone oxidoreductase subunit C